MPKKTVKKKAVKKKSSRQVAKKSPKNFNHPPQFPSHFKVGQECCLNFGISGGANNCTISAVSFTEDKVYYDVDVILVEAHINETDNTIHRYPNYSVTLKNVDSICVCEIKK